MGWISYPSAADVPDEEWPWPNFTPAEMACRHTGAVHLSRASMDRLQGVRRAFDQPMVISSGYRSPEHPIEARKATKSGAHTTGQAFDVQVSGEAALRLVRIAVMHGFTGIGVQQKGPRDKRFIHLDDAPALKMRPRPHIWSY